SVSCGECGSHFPACVVTGRAVIESKNVWICKTCKHRAYEDGMRGRVSCPLCHGAVDGGAGGGSRQAASNVSRRRIDEDPLDQF
ncbi:hypothetical protein T492DRAFT_890307, partial [Pavlovales sp. CCMP2436]